MSETIYAGFWARSLACIIDGVLTSALLWTFFTLFKTFFLIITHHSYQESLLGSLAFLVLEFIAPFAYEIYFVTSAKQATLGRIVMGIYVGNKDGSPISALKCVGRLFAEMLSLLIFFVGYLMVGFTKEKTALHDLICETRVFRGRK